MQPHYATSSYYALWCKLLKKATSEQKAFLYPTLSERLKDSIIYIFALSTIQSG
jgi:hypothetical protein